MNGIGNKDGKLCLQGKIRFPDIKAHHYGFHTLMFPVIPGTLLSGPQKTDAPIRDPVYLGFIDSHGEGRYARSQIAGCGSKQNPPDGVRGIVGIREHQAGSLLPVPVNSCVIDPHVPGSLGQFPLCSHLGQALPCSCLVRLLQIGIARAHQHRLYLAGLPGHRIGGIVLRQGIPPASALKGYGAQFTAQRLPLPGERFEENQPALSRLQAQLFDLLQLFPLVQADLQRGRHIAVIGETGSANHIEPSVRLFRIRIRQKIVGHIVHRAAHDSHLGIKISGKSHGFLRAVAVREYKDFRRSRLLPRLSSRAAQGLHHPLSPLQIPGTVAALNPVQSGVQTLPVPHSHCQHLGAHTVAGNQGKSGSLRSGDQAFCLVHSLLQTRPALPRVMLHTAAGIQHQHQIPPAGSLPLEVRGHQSQHQQNQYQNLKIHQKIVNEFLQKGLGLLVTNQLVPQQIRGNTIVFPPGL